MSFVCQYCKNSFTVKKNLDRHIKTAYYCLSIQKSAGLIIPMETYKCECGYTCNLKHNLSLHKKKCSTSINTANTTNTTNTSNTININNTINNNLNITVNILSISDLNTENIINLLRPVLTLQILKDGIGALTEIIVTAVLQQNGRYIYYCTDRARKHFKMIINDEGKEISEPDNDAVFIRKLFSIPLRTIVKEIIGEDKKEEFKDIYTEIKSLRTHGKTFTQELANILPSSSDRIRESLLKKVQDTDRICQLMDEQEEKERAEKELKKEEEKKEEELKCKENKYREYIANATIYFGHPSNETHYLNKVGFVIKTNISMPNNSAIVGKDIGKGFSKLTKKNIKQIREMGLGEYIDPCYLIN